jgi:hypothetical protein
MSKFRHLVEWGTGKLMIYMAESGMFSHHVIFGNNFALLWAVRARVVLSHKRNGHLGKLAQYRH